MQIISVAYAEVKNITASDTAIFDFGEDDAQIVNTVKNVAKMRAIQVAKEKAGVFVKSQTKTVNGILTDDDISAYTSNNIEILDVQYKKVPVQAHDVKGNDTGKIAFMYEATITAKVDTEGLTTYIKRDEQEKFKLIQQNKSSKENIFKINQDFDNLRNSLENIEQIKYKLNQIDNEVLEQQKIDEGWKAWENKNFEQAFELFNEAIQLNPNDYKGYYGRGTVNFDLRNYHQSIKDFDKAIQYNPNIAGIYNNRGNVYFDALDFDKALEDYTKAIQLDSNLSFAYSNRGKTYMSLRKYDDAIVDLKTAIKIDPNCIPAYHNLANYYDYVVFNGEEAIKNYSKAIQLEPDNFYTYYERGVCYYNLGNYEMAVNDFSILIQFEPNNGGLYYERGCYYEALGRKAEAKKDFAKARELGYNG